MKYHVSKVIVTYDIEILPSVVITYHNVSSNCHKIKKELAKLKQEKNHALPSSFLPLPPHLPSTNTKQIND